VLARLEPLWRRLLDFPRRRDRRCLRCLRSALHEAGRNKSEIARQFGVTPTRVRQILGGVDAR
jgi:DNA-directed RNA polymerase sigma subunit (sigma70/sigma32)